MKRHCHSLKDCVWRNLQLQENQTEFWIFSSHFLQYRVTFTLTRMGSLHNCHWWMGCGGIGEPEGEPATGQLESDRILIWLRTGGEHNHQEILSKSQHQMSCLYFVGHVAYLLVLVWKGIHNLESWEGFPSLM